MDMVKKLTFEEKALLLTGAASMQTSAIDRLDIPSKNLADGPHGVRVGVEENCTSFPSLAALAATWSVDAAEKMGDGLALDCIKHNIDMLLGPGVNIKRNILCGRNFEYLSEDPILAGELAAGYINGLQKRGVAASLKHFAMNSQETNRTLISAEADERTMRELYFKPFEIAVKKSKPVSVMCAYNKVGGLWCSENPYLLNEILRDDWNYDGFVISDWGAVHDIVKSIKSGLDLQMPYNDKIIEELKQGLDSGEITMEEIDCAVQRVLKFIMSTREQDIAYNRDEQHKKAREIAEESIVLLKNNDVLPLKGKQKIAIIGEFAEKPITCGQGSATVYADERYIESPLQELKKAMPDSEIQYMEIYKTGEFSNEPLWRMFRPVQEFTKDADAVILFVGNMLSDDTEFVDRRSAYINRHYEMFIDKLSEIGKKPIVVLQSGSAMIVDSWRDKTSAIIQAYLSGEAMGGAIADVICGKINPSGKLPETFPKKMRTDIDDITGGLVMQYTEGLDVGYRYYDKHPEEICYPFGYGLSYTEFKYDNLNINATDDFVDISFDITNTGKFAGKEIAQIYVTVNSSVVSKPNKELKAFKKVFIKPGETVKVDFKLTKNEFAYYNTMLHQWVAESGIHTILVGASSRDIRLQKSFTAKWSSPYSVQKIGTDMIG